MRHLRVTPTKALGTETPRGMLALVGAFEGCQHGARFRHWTDATTPRTDRPVRFYVLHRCRGVGAHSRHSYVTADAGTIPMVA